MGGCISSQRTDEHDQQDEAKSKTHEGLVESCAPSLSDFELGRVIGKGAFGKVKIVVHRGSGETYALKYISKVACVVRQAAANVIRERKILEVLHHPLVCNLRYAFQDSEYLYLVSDLMLGGDMRFHLLRKTFTEVAIGHWIAETAAALHYCHSRGIVHRDVKPDNILFTAEGHVKLADFNISTQIRNNHLPHSRSGSLFYMAPEVFEGVPYGFAVDYWGLGIVMFEAIYGHRPFGGKNNAEVGSNVCRSEVVHQECTPSVTRECQQAIDKLLEKDPARRCHTLAELTALPFFESLDWPLLEIGQSAPVFIPGSAKNFDAAWELEEILLHDSPLESRRPNSRKKVEQKDAQAAEMFALIEEHFTAFNHEVTANIQDEKMQLTRYLNSLNRQASESGLCNSITSLETEIILENENTNIMEMQSPCLSAMSTVSPKERTGFFKSKKKHSVVLPNGVLAMKAGGRVKA